MQDNFFEDHLTENAQQSLQQANELARAQGSSYIGTEHILLGVLRQDGSIGAKVLNNAGVTFDKASTALDVAPAAAHSMSSQTITSRGLNETAKLTLTLSWKIARDFGQKICGTAVPL
ncbi:hypothetical protein BRC20_00295 [Candidatus Saccharibacteria bacterium QS_8_54_8]|nr:MAG: hypothetical protein BRC20_00295 [Candidatus Saccharibacteria bacterium QS_8_54_8]